MNKPKRLEVIRSIWNDGCHPYSVVWAFFDEPQREIPAGWELVRRDASHREVAYAKHWPYGATVVNGRIVI